MNPNTMDMEMSLNTDAVMQELVRWSREKHSDDKDKGWRGSILFSTGFIIAFCCILLVVIIVGLWWWMGRKNKTEPNNEDRTRPNKQAPEPRRRSAVQYVTSDGRTVAAEKVRS